MAWSGSWRSPAARAGPWPQRRILCSGDGAAVFLLLLVVGLGLLGVAGYFAVLTGMGASESEATHALVGVACGRSARKAEHGRLAGPVGRSFQNGVGRAHKRANVDDSAAPLSVEI